MKNSSQVTECPKCGFIIEGYVKKPHKFKETFY